MTESECTNTADSFYRALARQLHGNPDQYKRVKDVVMHHFLRVHANRDHLLHDLWEEQQTDIFALLDCPDLTVNEELYFIATHALNIRLAVYHYKEIDRPASTYCKDGTVNFPVYKVLLTRQLSLRAADIILFCQTSAEQLRIDS